MKKLLVITYMTSAMALIGCASSSEWVAETVQNEKWNWCRQDLDGPDFVDRGWCFSYRVCRKKIFGGKECKVARKFCEAGDISCLQKNRLTNKWLTDEPFDI